MEYIGAPTARNDSSRAYRPMVESPSPQTIGKVSHMLRWLRVLCVSLALGLAFILVALIAPSQASLSTARALAAAQSSYDWFQFNFDSAHSGNNTLETTISKSNVKHLAVAFQVKLPSTVDGAPAYLSGVTTINGIQDLLFMTTRSGHILAVDARTGVMLWSHQYGPAGCKVNLGPVTCYTTSSPAIDPKRQFVYSYGLDGYIHKYQVGDGTEITSGGFPELSTRKGFDEKGSSALSIATSDGTSYLYSTHSGYPVGEGDRGDYQGHITAVNLTTGSQHVFNAVCSNRTDVHFKQKPAKPDCPTVQAAIWARPGVVYDSATNKIYATTGNGIFDPALYYWGDTVFALHPDGTGANGNPLDTYTPTNFQQLQDVDNDLGSSAVAILPVPAQSKVIQLGVQSGKDAKLRLLNLAKLSGQKGVGHVGGEVGSIIDVPQGGEVLTQPAVWVNPNKQRTFVFVANDNGISALRLSVNSAGIPQLVLQWQSKNGGTSPIIANNVLYYVSSHNVWALDPPTGKQLWHDTKIGRVHWQSPIVANGYLYVPSHGRNLTAYHLPD